MTGHSAPSVSSKGAVSRRIRRSQAWFWQCSRFHADWVFSSQEHRRSTHGRHLALGDQAGKVFHPAVSGDNDTVGIDVVERASYSLGHKIGALDVVGRQINHPEDDGLVAQ